jgi:hypothetical protein
VVEHDSDRLSPGLALLVIAAWIIVAFAAATITISRRDA